jgi:hypothetical protein
VTAYTERRRDMLEQRLGRQLTAAETHIRIEQIDALLNRAKDLLDAEIKRAQANMAAAIARGEIGRLDRTPRMLSLLRHLREHGAAHAANELASMGYPVRTRTARRLQAPDEDELAARLRVRLGELQTKIQREAVGLDLSELAADAIERALVAVLGARSIAADLVAPAFTAGLAQTFEQHADLVEQWQYTAVLDAGLCGPCAELDGAIFDTLEALFEVLPDFGGNPDCDGGDRCRCRAVPVPA